MGTNPRCGPVRNHQPTKLSKLKRSTPSPPPLLTGERRELLTQFKTKDNAVPAGLSLPSAMEGAHFIHSAKLLKLSESQLVDCDKTSSGCNGGLEIWAFNYAKANAIELEGSYPYVARTQSCKSKKSKGVVTAVSHKAVKSKSVPATKSAVQAGPTCVSVDAANNYF